MKCHKAWRLINELVDKETERKDQLDEWRKKLRN
jgi:hypothetical protein